ncbi:MAG: type II secretion system protein [Candidatus Brocadiia bacterium]
MVQEKTHRIPGFTLIELLVVIAVIAILAAMLMPALEQARKSAQSVSCISRQRQFVTAISFYRNDYGGFYPVRSTMGMDFLGQIGPYIDPGQDNYYNSAGMWNSHNDSDVNMFLCPGHHFVPGSHSQVIYGNREPYIRMAHIDSWRVYNFTLSVQFGWHQLDVYPTGGPRLRFWGNPAGIIMMGGQAGPGSGRWGRLGWRWIPRVGIFPHPGNSTNYSFLDGHVRNMGDVDRIYQEFTAGEIAFNMKGYGWDADEGYVSSP